jgi:hypothetical protein
MREKTTPKVELITDAVTGMLVQMSGLNMQNDSQ